VTDDDGDYKGEPRRPANPLSPDSEFEMCKTVISSVRGALREAEEELRQAKRAWQAKVHSLEQELRMLEMANERLRTGKK
jgi:hypothetical protein